MYASKNREDFFWNKKEQHSNHCYVIWEKATFAEQIFALKIAAKNPK